MELIIKINGQDVSINVSTEVYKFLDRAKHKQENLAHEKRRHWDNREFNEYIILNEGHHPYYLTPEDIFCQKETLKEIMQVLELCSKKQRRRFLLYALEGLSYSEIGKLENCSRYSVWDSIEAVKEKFKKYYRY